jgi:hypothetical protein
MHRIWVHLNFPLSFKDHTWIWNITIQIKVGALVSVLDFHYIRLALINTDNDMLHVQQLVTVTGQMGPTVICIMDV